MTRVRSIGVLLCACISLAVATAAGRAQPTRPSRPNVILIMTDDMGYADLGSYEWLSNGGPLFNRKWTVWEGGIRVPAIVRWPGRVRAGSVSDQPAITFDWSASILAAGAVAVPPHCEGIDLFPILERRAPRQERTFFWRSAPNSNRTQQAVRQGDWKLVVDANHLLLFNLRDDIGERRDLTAERPDMVRRLRPLLTEWAASVDADGKALKERHDRQPGNEETTTWQDT